MHFLEPSQDIFDEPEIHIPATDDTTHRDVELFTNNNSNISNNQHIEEDNHNNIHKKRDYAEFDSEELPLKHPLETGEKVWIWWEVATCYCVMTL